mgnify:CR=1 FL=1
MHPVDSRNSELAKSANWALARSLLLTATLYVIVLIPLLLFIRSGAFVYAPMAVAILVIIGAFYPHDYSSELSDIISPFDSDTASGFQANRVVNRVTGPAVIITHFIFGASRNIKLSFRLRKAIWPASAQDLDASTRIVAKLQKLGTTPRFHEVSRLYEDFEVVKKLVSLGIVWQTIKDGKIFVGLNRAYDNFTE